jgi:cellulase/cellobiase CelA1
MEFVMYRFAFAMFLLAGCERAETEEVVQGVIHDDSEGGLVQENPDLSVSISEDYSWGDGYCSLVTVTNTGGEEVDWEIRMSIDGEVSSYWNAEMEWEADEAVQFYGTDSNSLLQPDQAVEFGFCADL